MWVGRKATNQRTRFLESLNEGLKEQEKMGKDTRIEEWKEESKIITEREEYVEHMKARIEEWNTEVDQLDDKSQNSGPDWSTGSETG
jgi:benzoyl-CoA reductase/2-hydroxyglutaryl-CoA dehydratase subunit BcrC/BadD/HgdB